MRRFAITILVLVVALPLLSETLYGSWQYYTESVSKRIRFGYNTSVVDSCRYMMFRVGRYDCYYLYDKDCKVQLCFEDGSTYVLPIELGLGVHEVSTEIKNVGTDCSTYAYYKISDDVISKIMEFESYVCQIDVFLAYGDHLIFELTGLEKSGFTRDFSLKNCFGLKLNQ